MMGTREEGEDWAQDRCGIAADAHMLSQLAQLLQVPAPPQSRWRAATVTMFATNPLGVTSAYHQHVQDIEWPVPEKALISQAMALLYHRANHAAGEPWPPEH
jgi:hypothetical protein